MEAKKQKLQVPGCVLPKCSSISPLLAETARYIQERTNVTVYGLCELISHYVGVPTECGNVIIEIGGAGVPVQIVKAPANRPLAKVYFDATMHAFGVLVAKTYMTTSLPT